MRGRVIKTGRADTGRNTVLIEIDGDYEPINGPVEIKAIKEKRSLNANAYFYVLITRIAEKLQTSVDEVHNIMLARYGYPEIIDNNLVTITLREDIDPNTLDVHLKSTGHITTNSKGTRFINYLMIRGSHTYNTAEMSHLITGVISEAHEMGLETITPAEKERMLVNYGQHHT